MGTVSNSNDFSPKNGLSIILFGLTNDDCLISDNWFKSLSKNNIQGTVIIIPWKNDWGETLEAAKQQIKENWILLAPIESDPSILQWVAEYSQPVGQLDGVSFRRKGRKSPWIFRCLSWIFYYPFRILLELPLGPCDTWLGWTNWTWELQGYWLLGVRNLDPLNPIRLLRTEWFQQIPLQSKTSWGNLEMLAKAHFLGARLAEEICPIPTTVPRPSGNYWNDLTQLIQKPRFTPIFSDEKQPITSIPAAPLETK